MSNSISGGTKDKYRRGAHKTSFLIGWFLILAGCSLDGLVNVEDPEGRVELKHDAVVSRQGALGLYYSSIGYLRDALSGNSLNIGLFTDELTSRPAISHDGAADIHIDARLESTSPQGKRILSLPTYLSLQMARVSAQHATNVIRVLDDSTLGYVAAAAYAIEAYSILLLVENICSGIPLSRVSLEGKVEYSAGTSSVEAYESAIRLFDSALSVPHDSIQFITLAKIGKGRAYLGLGYIDSAMKAVEDVLIDYSFTVTYSEIPSPGGAVYRDRFWTSTGAIESTYRKVEVSNREGLNGLVWYSEGGVADPRVPIKFDTVSGIRVARQQKFVGGAVTFPLARGVEALLIRSEYYLQQGDSRWLTVLNEARRFISLPDTVDPGVQSKRIDLLFRERAYWFYLEGVRLADYRRLVRQYQRDPFTLYPRGVYIKSLGGTTPMYENTFIFEPSSSEEDSNHLYTGCQNRNL